MNAKKITSFETSMIRLRDIMMSVMFEQAEEIRKEHPVTQRICQILWLITLRRPDLMKSTEKSEEAWFADVQRYGMNRHRKGI